MKIFPPQKTLIISVLIEIIKTKPHRTKRNKCLPKNPNQLTFLKITFNCRKKRKSHVSAPEAHTENSNSFPIFSLMHSLPLLLLTDYSLSAKQKSYLTLLSWAGTAYPPCASLSSAGRAWAQHPRVAGTVLRDV